MVEPATGEMIRETKKYAEETFRKMDVKQDDIPNFTNDLNASKKE